MSYSNLGCWEKLHFPWMNKMYYQVHHPLQVINQTNDRLLVCMEMIHELYINFFFTFCSARYSLFLDEKAFHKESPQWNIL